MTWLYRVEFYGAEKDALKVGDHIEISGRAQVQAIRADMVDISGVGVDQEFALGGIEVDLIANRLEVS